MSNEKPSSSSSSKRLSWTRKYSNKDKDSQWTLVSPPEGVEVTSYQSTPSTHSPAAGGLPYTRSPPPSMSGTSPPSSTAPDRPAGPSRRSSTSSLTKQQLDQEASKIILNALERTNSASTQETVQHRPSNSFGRKSFSSMMGGLSALSLTRSSTDDKERGRTRRQEEDKPRSSSVMSSKSADDADSNSASRARSMSPFRRKRSRARDPSPSVEALSLSQSDVESDVEGTSRNSIRPRNAFSQTSALSDDDSEDDEDDESGSEESWSDNDTFDSITEQNTEQNSLIPPETAEPDTLDAPDPLGEGVNIVVPPEPYFPTTLNATGHRNPRRRKSTRHVSLPIDTSRPVFQRDRCTITLTQGDPALALQNNARRARRYVVASDLSEESRYAVEWGIGTVLRDGDEMLIVSVKEDESKVDPPHPNPTDRVSKLRNQQERQTLAYILVRQVMGLLQRTKLHVTVACQAWHAKNSRHMLLDIIDHIEPAMLIVGSRGLGQLKGILLGSTSHYLVQKCSVPVMVARRRLKRPARRSAHLSPHRARVSLAEAAGVESVTPRVDRDVENMRDELEREEERREVENDEEVEDDADTEQEGDTPTTAKIGEKVRGD